MVQIHYSDIYINLYYVLLIYSVKILAQRRWRWFRRSANKQVYVKFKTNIRPLIICLNLADHTLGLNEAVPIRSGMYSQ